jgi:30S ribosomal protein S31
MGKGDIRTKRGKIYRGTYGNRRRKKRRKKAAAEAAKAGKGERQ